MKTLEGQLDARPFRFGIVVSKYNEFVTSRLLAGAVEVLTKAGASDEAIEVTRVPGAFEIPLVARRMARSGRFDAVICLGAVIRGETSHFEYISAEASRGIAQAAWESDLPVIFGVLTTETVEQALERAGAPERNKGAEAARTAIEMANLMKQLQGTIDKSTSRRIGRNRTKRKR
ncbi:MAG: 6,7-dimethyl-8-ribityllumazine synthase [Nitrospirota bacterium]|mgnify:CR=1 FL=1|jgi:6,7-dimethyl-8-ribityllumazine synthase